MLCVKKLKLNWSIRGFGLHALPSHLDHSFRCITGENGDVKPCKKERIFPSTAIEFQDMSAGLKGVGKDFPYGCALGSDPCARKQVIIPLGETVKCQDCLILNFGDGSQAYTSETVKSRPNRAS